MRLLLINPESYTWLPEQYYLPSSLMALGTLAEQTGATVSVLDLNVIKYKKNKDCQNSVLERVREFEPQLVGIGCMFAGQLESVMKYSKSIKDIFPYVKIVVGGMQPTLFSNEILENCASIDFIAIGEGELPLVLLMQYMDEVISIERVPSLAYRSNGSIVHNARKVVNDLNILPMSNYSLVKIPDYYHEETLHWHNPRNLPINATLPILTSRGCPFSCNFCCLYEVMGKKMRYKNPQFVVDEIEFLYKEHNHRHFSFFDDNLIIKKSHIMEVCNEIVKRNLNIQFETPNGVAIRFIDEEVLSAMCTAGMVNLSLPIEHGSEYIRNHVIRKGLPTEKIYEVAELTKKYTDLLVRAFFIIGFPEETPQTLQDTFDMIQKIDVDKPIVNNLMPYAGTAVFNQCVRDNLFIDKIDLKNIWKLGDLSFSSTRQFYIRPYNMSVDELEEFRKKFDVFVANQIKRKARWHESTGNTEKI